MERLLLVGLGRAGPRGPERDRWAPAEAAAAATLDGRWTDERMDGASGQTAAASAGF